MLELSLGACPVERASDGSIASCVDRQQETGAGVSQNCQTISDWVGPFKDKCHVQTRPGAHQSSSRHISHIFQRSPLLHRHRSHLSMASSGGLTGDHTFECFACFCSYARLTGSALDIRAHYVISEDYFHSENAPRNCDDKTRCYLFSAFTEAITFDHLRSHFMAFAVQQRLYIHGEAGFENARRMKCWATLS